MHNGEIAQFEKVKRNLQTALSDEIFLVPQGNTDSEWAFALYLSKLPDVHAENFTPEILRRAMLDTIAHLNMLARDAGITEPSLLNFTVTDGATIVASRYISSKCHEAASLYFSSGTTFNEYAPGGHYRMSKSDKRENIILVASEPLTFEKADWMEIKTNTLIVITPKMNILQIPIIDEFSASSTSKRDVQFATDKGLWAQNPRRVVAASQPTDSENRSGDLSVPVPFPSPPPPPANNTVPEIST